MSEIFKKPNVIILDTSGLADFADYDGALYELKKVNICDGREFQIDNGGDLLMKYDAYRKCSTMLERFGIRPVNLY